MLPLFFEQVITGTQSTTLTPLLISTPIKIANIT